MFLLWQLRALEEDAAASCCLQGGRSNKLLLEVGRRNKFLLGSNRQGAEAPFLQWGKLRFPHPPIQSSSR